MLSQAIAARKTSHHVHWTRIWGPNLGRASVELYLVAAKVSGWCLDSTHLSLTKCGYCYLNVSLEICVRLLIDT